MAQSLSLDSEISQDKELLLAYEYEGRSGSLELFKQSQSSSRPQFQRLSVPLTIHAILITAYTIIYVFLIKQLNNENRTSLVYSPARSAVSLTTKTVSVLYNDTTNLFLKPPSKALDRSWYELLQNMNIRIKSEESSELGKSSIVLGDGSGDSLGSLDVYHQLHCVRYLKYFVEGAPLPPMRVQPKDHANHCIELIRQVLMCHGDISVVTYDWLPDDPVPMPRWEMEHECVNWDKLDSWMYERRISMSAENMIVHPDLGPSYPRKGDR